MKRLLFAAFFAFVPILAFAQQDTEGHYDIKDLEERYERMRTDHADTKKEECTDTENRLSFSGFDHCRMHPFYEKVFPRVGCNCSTGQCRPTEFQRVRPTAANPTGVEIKIDGKYYPVPESILHKMVRGRVPEAMLEYTAHVCAVLSNGKLVIECVWIDPLS